MQERWRTFFQRDLQQHCTGRTYSSSLSNSVHTLPTSLLTPITTPFRSLTVTAGLPASLTPGGYTIALWSPTTPAVFLCHLRHLHRGGTGHPSLVHYDDDNLSMSSPTSTTLTPPPFHAMPTFVRRRLQHHQPMVHIDGRFLIFFLLLCNFFFLP
jgi:hypothetical protein